MPKGKGKKGKGKGNKEENNVFFEQKKAQVKEMLKTLYAIYDPDETETIKEEDFNDFVRSLGLYPTNAKLKEIAAQCREDETNTFFNCPKLESVLIPLVIDAMINPNSELAPPSEEKLLLALKSLDLEHKGHLTEGDFRTILSSNGEKLDPDELDPAVEEAVNPATGVVNLEIYAGHLLYNAKIF